MKVANCDRLPTYKRCQLNGFYCTFDYAPTASFLRPSISLLYKHPTTGSFKSSLAFRGGYVPKLPGKSENPRVIDRPPPKTVLVFLVFSL